MISEDFRIYTFLILQVIFSKQNYISDKLKPFSFFSGANLENAFVHGLPRRRTCHPVDRQIYSGRARLPLLRRLHDPAQAFAQVLVHSEGIGSGMKNMSRLKGFNRPPNP
jgi:hypothetical protein